MARKAMCNTNCPRVTCKNGGSVIGHLTLSLLPSGKLLLMTRSLIHLSRKKRKKRKILEVERKSPQPRRQNAKRMPLLLSPQLAPMGQREKQVAQEVMHPQQRERRRWTKPAVAKRMQRRKRE